MKMLQVVLISSMVILGSGWGWAKPGDEQAAASPSRQAMIGRVENNPIIRAGIKEAKARGTSPKCGWEFERLNFCPGNKSCILYTMSFICHAKAGGACPSMISTLTVEGQWIGSRDGDGVSFIPRLSFDFEGEDCQPKAG